MWNKGDENEISKGIDPEQLEVMLREASSNLINFRKYLLETDESEELPSPDFHYIWSDILLHAKENFAVEGYRESAKALPIDSKIATPCGYRRIADLEVGDKVFGGDGKEATVCATSEEFNNGCYELTFSDGTSCVCNEDHLWKVFNKRKRKMMVHDTRYISETYQGWSHKNGYMERIYKVPLCGAVEYLKKSLKIHPYFLGLWLGDGSKNFPLLTIGEEDREQIYSRMKECGYKLIQRKSDKIMHSVHGEMDNFRYYKLFRNKHIPRQFMESSIEDRLELLRGLIDSDGTVARTGSKRGTVTFCNCNKRIADDTLELVRSLGIKATMTIGMGKLNGKDCNTVYKVSFKTAYRVSTIDRKDNTKYGFSERSKWKIIVNVKKVPSVPTKCIMVDSADKTFIVGKEYTVTHNTSMVTRAFPLYCMTFPRMDLSYIAIVKATLNSARGKLKEIAREYFSNPILSSRLIKVLENSADVLHIVLHSGEETEVGGHPIPIEFRMEAYSKGAAIRGIAYKNKRPDVCLLDDIQGIEDSRSETVCENDWIWFLSDVFFLGRKTRIFMIGNNLGDKCVIERIMNDPESVGFKTMVVPVMDRDGRPTWPASNSAEEIEEERANFDKLGKIDIWMREKMCVAVAEENRVINANDIKYYHPSIAMKIASSANIFSVMDIATTTKLANDYTAIVTVAVTEDNNWFVLDCDYGRWLAPEIIEHLIHNVRTWRPMAVGIEKGGLKNVVEPFIQAAMAKNNVFFNITPINCSASKETRVELALAPRFAAGCIYFPETATWLAEMKTELLSLTRTEGFKCMHDDLADALSGVDQIARAPIGISTGVGPGSNRRKQITKTECNFTLM